MKVLSLVLVLFLANPDKENVISNNETVNFYGMVVEEATGEPLTGVQVYIPEIDQEVYTDFDGNFELNNLKPGEYNVEISFISFKKKELNKLKIEPDNNTILISLN
jgi:hypothetical protein